MWCIKCQVKAGYVVDMMERLYMCPQCQDIWKVKVAQLGGKAAVAHYERIRNDNGS